MRITLYALAGTAAILLTAVAVLISIDLGMFKDRVEVLVTDLLGRELRIDGELHANIGTSFVLYAEDVYLANPEWADREAFVTAHKIDIAVDTWSLLKGPVEIKRLEIDGVRVNIEKNEEGGASWQFEKLEKAPDAEPEETAPPRRLPLVLQYAAINDIKVAYDAPAMAKPLLLPAGWM